MSEIQTYAQKAISLIDLTSLNDDDDQTAIRALCEKTITPFGKVAAVCVYPKFVKFAKQTLAEIGAEEVKVATVTNFPFGDLSLSDVLQETEQAILDGADEIDLVIDYKGFLNGETEHSVSLISKSKALCLEHNVLLKVIIETGKLESLDKVEDASHMAINAGADFIKTSTGKVEVNATLPFAKTMLSVIKEGDKRVGFKAAGGIKTADDAAEYLKLAEQIMGQSWVSPESFRFGASSLLENLASTLTHGEGGSISSSRSGY